VVVVEALVAERVAKLAVALVESVAGELGVTVSVVEVAVGLSE